MKSFFMFVLLAALPACPPQGPIAPVDPPAPDAAVSCKVDQEITDSRLIRTADGGALVVPCQDQ